MLKPVDFEFLKRTTDSFFSKEELLEKLKENRPLIIKYGVDVTSPFLHIGHAVNLWMMRYLQECGHKVVFLIGDFTTRIGDPTGKSKLRKVIEKEEIEKNAKEFIKQVSKVLLIDKAVFEVKYNSSWFEKMKLDSFLSLCSMVTYSKLIQRDMFQERIKNKKEIHIHEMLYPLFQGYDSVELKSDLTIVGTDQLFNELMGRFYQERFNQKPQVIITTKITAGTDGKEKQSKSLNNYIALEDSARDKFGKIMSLSDELIFPYLEVYTTLALLEIEKMKKEKTFGKNPMEIKKILAKALVERYHGIEKAEEEKRWFEEVFSKRKAPQDIFEVKIEKDLDILSILKKCMPQESNSSIVRLIKQDAVKINDKKIDKEKRFFELNSGDIIKIGKRKWFKVIF